MHIHIKTVSSGWILERIANHIADSNKDIFTVGYESNSKADANFYIDIGNCFQPEDFNISSLKIGYFTHLHENSTKWIPPQCQNLDFIVHKCTRYYKQFQEIGFNKDRMSLIYPYETPKEFELKKPTIGIFQRGEHEGKGFFFMKYFLNKEVCKNFKWLFVGSGWDKLGYFNNVEIVDEPDYPNGYFNYFNKCDYVLIPSLWEAGPISMVDSLSIGLPVIASDVGWVNLDFKPDFLYPPGDQDSLETILTLIFNKIKRRKEQVEHLSWKTYGEKLIRIVERLKNG